MKVSELFQRLSFGELSNLAISQEGSGVLIESRQPQIILYANEALIRIFSRFNISQKYLLIELVESITYYHLKRQFAESNTESTETYKYIKDTEDDPFTEDVIRILEVKDIENTLLHLNDPKTAYPLYTPQPDILQVPNPVEGDPLGVIYQARHPVLLNDITDSGFMDQEIDIPFFAEGALLNFIAHRVYSHMNGEENTAKSIEFYQFYEVICSEIESKELVDQGSGIIYYKLEQKGFV